MGLTKTCQSREPRATSVEADANARHAVPAVLWTIPLRQSPTSLFHATANMTAGTARMSKFIAKTTTSVVVIVDVARRAKRHSRLRTDLRSIFYKRKTIPVDTRRL